MCLVVVVFVDFNCSLFLFVDFGFGGREGGAFVCLCACLFVCLFRFCIRRCHQSYNRLFVCWFLCFVVCCLLMVRLVALCWERIDARIVWR